MDYSSCLRSDILWSGDAEVTSVDMDGVNLTSFVIDLDIHTSFSSHSLAISSLSKLIHIKYSMLSYGNSYSEAS